MSIAALFDPDVVCFEGEVRALAERVALFAEEERAIERAVERRRLQYRASRFLARRAFRELGHGDLPLLNHEDRSPRWPEGVVGSLTHTDDWCAVVVALSSRHVSLGIDGEDIGRLHDELQPRVLTERELTFLRTQTAAERQRLATLFFSGKESLYKCQFPLTRTFLGFHDVELEIQPDDVDRGRFDCHWLRTLSQLDGRYHFEGKYLFSTTRVVTAVVCRRR